MTTFWGPDLAALEATDPEIADVVLDEVERIRDGLQLVASENLTSPAVLAALGSTLTDKYADGYPGRREYPGCGPVDRAEEIGVARAEDLFDADHANLQPYSGTSANLAVYTALLEPGDKVLAFDPRQGGHATHGHARTFSGRWYDVAHYGVRRDTELIDLDAVREQARAVHPKVIICGGTSYPRLIDFAAFREIADEVGALLWVDAAHLIGLVAGGAIPSPVPHADVVTCTTHKVLRGPRGGLILCRAALADRIDAAVFPFTQGGPLMNAVAAKAVAFREASLPPFRAYAAQVVRNARALAEGLAAAGARPVTGGTDVHLALLDVRPLGLTGREIEERCAAAKITLGRNGIPFDPEDPDIASGIRVGTPALTTRGMREGDLRDVAGLVVRAARATNEAALSTIAEEVTKLAHDFPAYAG